MLSNDWWIEKIWEIITTIQGLASEALAQTSSLDGAIVTGINRIANLGVKPVASIVLSLFCLLELYKWASRTEGLSSLNGTRIELLLMVLFKMAIAVYFVQSVDSLMWGIYDLMNALMTNINNLSFSNNTNMNSVVNYNTIKTMVEGMSLSFVEKILAWIGLLPVSIIVSLSKVAVFVIFKGRLIEIYVLVALSPLPLVTLVNSEFSQIGKSFIKSFTAVCLQGGVLMIVLQVYGVVLQGVVIDSSSINGVVWSFAAYGILLIVSLIGSSALAKRLVNAM